MNFLLKLVFIIAIYGAGFYMGLNYEGSDDHVEDTLEHLKDLKTQGIKKGAQLIETLKAD